MPENEKYNFFVVNLTENYIDPETKFSISMWAEITGNFEITNACESFHFVFNSLFN